MRSLLPASAYHTDATWALEQRELFGRVWQFAGFTTELAQDNDYLVADVGGRSVVVQNLKGQLRAFVNVCSHRFARIHADERGNGPLRCPYHGWIYNAEGVPYSIPSRPRFDGLTPEVVRSLALRRFDLATCGTLLFVRGDVEGPSLEEWLGDAFPIAEAMSGAFGGVVDMQDLTIAANWKVNVENSLEGYHVGFVHPDTIKKLGTTGLDFRFYGPHTAHRAPVEPTMGAQLEKLAAKLDAAYRVDAYYHLLLFPNLTLTTTHGTVFGVQQFQPLDARRTRFRSWLFDARRGPGATLGARAAAEIGRSGIDFSRAVFAEDKGICERVQLGLPDAPEFGMLSEEEERVGAFQRAYLQAMAGGPESLAQRPRPADPCPAEASVDLTTAVAAA